MNKLKSLLQLYWTFFKIGGLTFGGGLTMLPMLERELVQKKKWVTSDELLDIYAIGQCTPGLIAVNTATFLGYKREKIAGGIIATVGMITPSLIIIMLVATFLKNFIDNAWFSHAMMGVKAVVCALLFNTLITLGKKTLISLPAWIIAVVVLLLSFFTPIPTICLVLMAATAGIIIDLVKNKVSKKEKEDEDEQR